MAVRTSLDAAILTISLILVGSPAIQAQDPFWDGLICAGWEGDTIFPEDGESHLPTCTMGMVPASEVPGLGGLDMGSLIDEADLFFVARDPAGDQFLLADGSVPEGIDTSTDILAAYFRTFDLNGRTARALRRTLSDLPTGAVLTAGQRVNQVVRPGEWTLIVLDTAGDPTLPPDGPRVFQIAAQGPPNRSVPATFPNTSPIDGARQVWHLRQDPDPAGGVRWSALASDFGSRRPGPDQQTQYYNARPRFFAVTTPEAVNIFLPFGPGGAIRPMAWDSSTGAWDIVSAPDGPMAFLPLNGRAAPFFDMAALLLDHTAIPGQTFSLDGIEQREVGLPSGLWELFLSNLLPHVQPPPPSAIGLDFGGRALLYEQMQAILQENEPYMWLYHHGVPGYGDYCLDRFAWLLDDATWADGTPVSAADLGAVAPASEEVRRAIGASCFRVDEHEGLLHASAWQPWLDGHGPPTFDPEAAAALLAEAGWVEGTDGVRRLAT